ncbi:unnamed protein product [Moneuplotes crassus]|uniref:3'-5' exonuclease domain-containing protein n=1 Tax=Euplotes crassus TaxID=5936 RepID=A0AAD1X668_EUPCR|nr:unnamed protein product [Moneuplotes crassus]
MAGHSVGVLDVITVSMLRKSEAVWNRMKQTQFEGLEHIYRHCCWIEGLMEIKYDKINGPQTNIKPKKAKKIKEKQLTGSKEVVQAVKSGDTKKVKMILKAKPVLVHSVDPNHKKKPSLIHIACANGDLEMCKLLKENNCNLEVLDVDYIPPIYWAIKEKHANVVEYVIGQDINLEHKDCHGRTALYMASRYGGLAVVQLLIDAGCDPNVDSKTFRTPLIKASNCRFADIVEALLATGKVDPEMKDYQGKTALHNCVYRKLEEHADEAPGDTDYGSEQITKMLLDYGAKVDSRDRKNNTPLGIAALNFGNSCIKLLIENGAEINVKNKYGSSPFMSACYNDNLECIKMLYEYDSLDTSGTNLDGYSAFELTIRRNQYNIIKWVIDEEVNNNNKYPGLDIQAYDKQKMLHHAVDCNENKEDVLELILEYIWSKESETIMRCFVDVLHRALLRSSKHAVHSLLAFYKHKELFTHFKLPQTVLESSIHFNDSDTFSQIVEYYDGELPQVALQSAVFTQNHHFATLIVDTFAEQFCDSEISQSAVCVPDEFTQVITNDVLQEYTYFARVAHPIFSDEAQTARFTALNPLQLTVSLDNTKLVKLLLDKTAYKASSLLPNGDNILHLVVSRSEGDSYILQKLLAQLEIETGSAEQVRTQFLEHKNEADGLSVLEFCAGMKIYAPIVFKYSSVAGCPDDDMYGAAEVLNVEIVHDQTPEQEASTDKKALAEKTRLAARQALKDLIKTTEALAKKYQFMVEYSAECGIDFSDPSYTEHIPSIKDKPCTFIDTLEALEQCGAELAGHKVLGVDLEFAGDKRIAIASLLQISTLEADYIVDALVLRHAVGPVLSPVFGDPAVVKVFHGCDYDILLLLTDLEVEVVNVFDTGRALQEMMRTVSSSEPLMTSFDYLVSAFLGFKANKFFQRAEWRLRPLPKVMLNYARADSHYLLFIYAVLIDLMFDPSKPIALPEETAQEHSEMLEFRSKEPKQWKRVLKELQKKMAKFMVQRIEKSGKRTYEVIIHKDY